MMEKCYLAKVEEQMQIEATLANSLGLLKQIKQLTEENAKLKDALEKINGFTMSQFTRYEDMSRACLTVSGEALKG